MKRLILGTALIVLTTAIAYAGGPAKVMDTSAGKVWTNGEGMTLYTFDKDEQGTSNCYDKCAANWPPLAAQADASAEGDWSLVERTDGSTMWAYKGMPLYTFVGDKAPGDVTGDGKGDVWHLAKAE